MRNSTHHSTHRPCRRTSALTRALTRAPTRAVVTLAAMLVTTVAQGAPPGPTVRSSPAPFIGFAVMFLLLGLILVPSLLPSKRSHQD